MGIRTWAAAAAVAACAWAGSASAQLVTVTFEGTVASASGVFVGNIGKPFTAQFLYGIDTGMFDSGPGYRTVSWAIGWYTLSIPVNSFGTPYMSAGYYSTPDASLSFAIDQTDWWGGIGFNKTDIHFGSASGEKPEWFPSDLFAPFSIAAPGVFSGSLSWELFDPVFDVYGSGSMTFDVSLVTLTSSVPEPSTWAMMLIGFAGLGYVAHRRRANYFLYS